MTEVAREDIDEIGTSHYGYDEASGDAFFEDLREALAQQQQFPLSGSPRQELGEGVRALLFSRRRYLLLHRFIDERVEVLRVVSPRQDPSSFFT